MTDPNGRSSSNATLRGMSAPEADVTDRMPMVPIEKDPVVAAEPRPNVTETPPIVVKRSAPRLLAKEFTIPTGWLRAPLRGNTADAGIDGSGADNADSSTQASAVARPLSVSLGMVLFVLVAATLVGVVALMLSRRDVGDSRSEAQKSPDSQSTTASPVAVPVPAPATASLVASADTSTAPSATAMPIAEPAAVAGTAAATNTLAAGQGAAAEQSRKRHPAVTPRPAPSVKPRPPIY